MKKCLKQSDFAPTTKRKKLILCVGEWLEKATFEELKTAGEILKTFARGNVRIRR